jgi:succinate dehydrogenase / fumarate reductase cytochrome b subunit
MVTSIVHRATGIALAGGTIFLVWWLLAAATSDDAFSLAQAFWYSWFGRLLLFGWTWSLFYHLSNGLRHLFWDAGYGYEIKTAYASGWTAITASVVLTVIAWVAAYMVRG